MIMMQLHHCLHCINIKIKTDKTNMVTVIDYRDVVVSTKNNFHQPMIDFVNKLGFNDQKYQSNGTSSQ